jgi:hypothetical protein
MALVPCRQCHQPFYASCHDASCIDALCPYCEYAEPVPHEPFVALAPTTFGATMGDSGCAPHPGAPASEDLR